MTRAHDSGSHASLAPVARIFTAHVRGGVIVADGLDLPEGAVVTVASTESDERELDLAAEELAELDAAIAAADGAEPVAFDDVLADLDRIGSRSE